MTASSNTADPSGFPRSAIEQSICARFAEQVAIHAQHTAVLTRDLEWSYTELDARANVIANAILDRCGSGSAPVVLLMDQGASLVATTLGVLKAGKFYVPLEPSHPIAQVREMFTFSSAELVIAQAKYHAIALQLAGSPERVLDPDTPSKHQRTTDPGMPVRAIDPAYIFFTSGSTGKPKGVVDSHRNVLHNIHRYTNALSIASGDRLTMIQSGTFSGTVSSFFSALLNGATLLPIDFRNEGFTRLADWMKTARASIYHSVPSIFRGVVEAGQRFPDVRVVRLEGDGASRADHEIFRNAFNESCILAHGLGATETGLSRQFRMSHDTPLDGDRLPIGYPLPDMDVRVVDEQGHLVAAGEIGEIEVRSEFLATGYWRDPDLTRARFAEDGTDATKRRYRSGDLGTMRADGCLYHLGRKDLEHRINGQWVSTAEVERALRSLGPFREVLAMTRKDTADEARLVAYLVMKEDVAQDPARWRKTLTTVLPAHMIPSAFIVVEAFPMSEHGKVDRKALPVPETEKRKANGDPTTQEERDMCTLWEGVLDVRPIGIRDDFFDLGGDSLRAALLVAKVEAVIGRLLAPMVLFTSPTVEMFLRRVYHPSSAPEVAYPMIALRTTGANTPYFCIDWPGGYGWNFARLAQLLGDEQPFYCIASGGIPEPWPPGTTIEHMATAVIARIRALHPPDRGPIRLGGNCYGGIIALEAARQLRAQGERIAPLDLFAISPKDFPTLVDAAAYTRFRDEESSERHARHLAEWAKRSLAEGLAYFIRVIGQKWVHMRASAVNAIHRAFNKPGPRTEPDIFLARDMALRAHKPQTLDGDVVLYLSEDAVRSYTADPATTFARLAKHVTVHLFPGTEDDLFLGPTVEQLAELLRVQRNMTGPQAGGNDTLAKEQFAHEG